MRVAVVDIGTNSTRLLIADVRSDGAVRHLVRRSEVTRLGERVDETGTLAEEAIRRTLSVLSGYRGQIDEHGCERNLAVLTSAVRDARNGAAFVARVRDELALDARVLSGEEEARLMFTGAMSGRVPGGPPGATRIDANGGPGGHAEPHPAGAPAGDGARDDRRPQTVVIDIGGGSTEIVVGSDLEPRFHVSLQAGVVRMSERHIHSDPPLAEELKRLARDARAVIEEGTREAPRERVRHGIAVAGTATSAAAIAQALDPYDPARVHGYLLSLATVEQLAERLGAMTEAQRRAVVGLHPDRAPTIVAGMALLREALLAFGLAAVEVSEHDILLGGALTLVSDTRPAAAS
jgi:exopolyphosphatase/guanosine-5'-triphosphate,3'-diphosphate pyrophosphatase